MEQGKLELGLRLKGPHDRVAKVRREIFAYLHGLGFEPGGDNREVNVTVTGSRDEVFAVKDTVAKMANDATWNDFETQAS